MFASWFVASLLLSLAGCQGHGELLCARDVHDWYDNPTYTLVQADTTGAFDFDPVGEPIQRRNGKYNLNNGSLHYTDHYKSGYYLDERVVDGFGTIYDNGNLDLAYTSVVTDCVGVISALYVRMERTRCEGTLSVWDVDPASTWDQGPPAGTAALTRTVSIDSPEKVTSYMQTTSSGQPYIENTTYTPDVLYTSEVDIANGGYVSRSTMDLDGTGRANWSQFGAIFGDAYDYAGTTRYLFNGGYHEEYTIYEAGTQTAVAEMTIDMAYDGTGTGTYTEGNTSCDLVYAAGDACTYTCSDGSTGRC